MGEQRDMDAGDAGVEDELTHTEFCNGVDRRLRAFDRSTIGDVL